VKTPPAHLLVPAFKGLGARGGMPRHAASMVGLTRRAIPAPRAGARGLEASPALPRPEHLLEAMASRRAARVPLTLRSMRHGANDCDDGSSFAPDDRHSVGVRPW